MQIENMGLNIIGLKQASGAAVSVVGGKGANLGELASLEHVNVPDGFCISTRVYQRVVGNNAELRRVCERLNTLTVNDIDVIRSISASVRQMIMALEIPQLVVDELEVQLRKTGETEAYAIRSSATAEDLPEASFAGQQDSFLNVVGKDSIVRHISMCWASLYTERAVIYRIKNGFDHQKVSLSVLIQRMVFPEVSGIMFTADPVSSNRKVVSIDASFGLGEALVSGLVNADHYKVKEGRIIKSAISSKKMSVEALKNGGTEKRKVHPERQDAQTLTDQQVLELAGLGRRIEAHFGTPQDIEWCMADGIFYLVQSRPITTLFPVPEAGDSKNHVYISVGHQQMMTDPMKPLGLSMWQLRAARPMYEAGGRLFVDVAENLGTPAGRNNLLDAMGQHDPLIKEALLILLERGDFIEALPESGNEPTPVKSTSSLSAKDILAGVGDELDIVPKLIKDSEVAVKKLKADIQDKTGTDLFDFIMDDIAASKQATFKVQHMGVIIAAMNASSWINDKMNEWLGEKNAADVLTQSVPYNVTSEMGLALLDVADAIRPYPELLAYLQEIREDHFLDNLHQFEGGSQARNAIKAFLDKYGMRCAGEIDITRTRWAEKPGVLIALIISNVKNFRQGAGPKKFNEKLQEALDKERSLLEQLEQLPDGQQKASDARQIISLLRRVSGYREYPKYDIVSRFFVYKQALLKEAGCLLKEGLIDDIDDMNYLRFEELREMVATKKENRLLIRQRREEFNTFERLSPPRVMTSDGEIVTGQYRHKKLPKGAIPGLGVSAGVVVGRARVILNMEDADLKAGDILVTKFTDPSWTPLFVSISGLVTEVGGLMTHGAVIAREYGLPAVVGVEHATSLIKDGQNIRLDGSIGYVEILER